MLYVYEYFNAVCIQSSNVSYLQLSILQIKASYIPAVWLSSSRRFLTGWGFTLYFYLGRKYWNVTENKTNLF
jgi:hypothetical protein